MQVEARAAQAEADRLLREAIRHRQAAGRHRKQAREKREQLNRLIAACAARGVQITIHNTEPGGHSGNADPQQTIKHG